MKHYVIYNQAGKILETLATDQTPPDPKLFNSDRYILEIPEPLDNIHLKSVQNGQVVNIPPAREEFSYDFNRYLEYPILREQIGALWHDIDQGIFGENAKQGSFYNNILNIKNKFPKPQ